jgi:hypothetical protein
VLEYRDGDALSLGGGMGAASNGYLPEGCRGLDAFVVSPF